MLGGKVKYFIVIKKSAEIYTPLKFVTVILVGFRL